MTKRAKCATLLGMDTRIRNIPDDLWNDFKKSCLDERTSCNTKLLDLIQFQVDGWNAERRKNLAKELDELNQKKMF